MCNNTFVLYLDHTVCTFFSFKTHWCCLILKMLKEKNACLARWLTCPLRNAKITTVCIHPAYINDTCTSTQQDHAQTQ